MKQLQDKPGSVGETNQASPVAPALEIVDVHVSFKERRRKLPVLNGLSLTVAKGEFVAIVGPSGCGKSTLFHIIGGLLKPQAGEVLMNGIRVTAQRGHISYMPQQPALFPWRTIEENVLLASEVASTAAFTASNTQPAPRPEALAEARQWLGSVGLAGFEQAYPHQLSGGMQQRVAFLRALLSPQELMLLDEPFSALDALTRSDMQRWLLDIWEQNRRSVLFITHNIEEALLLADRVYVLSNRPAAVLHEVQVPFDRPRREEMTEDPAFLKRKRQIAQWMKEEQQKARLS
ncbi:ABC transporter ATP-binding protein [Paenibacillus barcinonensis]|uniref:ABC transporter ATP-binding protein n=1 Tax=Paenibacillus barcinonensis TaxID=198119 RepID=A0A2V4VRH3_PAEBA|nr:ABC transporter ATP-binding protein [Paenibacillus barcinonensis]PYE47340.1 ABC-type nitrate/sulfonate/bicarbonate transport system ATPase subunit [Paenibacillus barcinonensis]QKS58236.1 ABC transporter ATP-binding protein [Paenibacillus barcinonensis]